MSFEEFADYYRRHGVGRVQVAVGRAPATDALTDALLRALDRDGDGRVSKAEWRRRRTPYTPSTSTTMN